MARTRTKKKPKVCLVLQGGGALGAYHIGAYQALEEAGYSPDWFAGISIGALNSAILAGNKPEDRLNKLTDFWDRISRPETDIDLLPSMAPMLNTFSASQALIMGQPDFFVPRIINPWLSLPGESATSFYDTSPLFSTIDDLSDFSIINQHKARLTVGATSVTKGELVFFDSHTQPLKPAHVVASGSLPPGFPATQIGDDHYWDGGCVSNSPINGILDLARKDEDLLVFMVDLWNAKGELPQTMSEVLWREKEIQYASRSCDHIEALVAKCNLDHILEHSKDVVDSEQMPDVVSLKVGRHIDIVHITFDPLKGHIPLSDADFSRRSIRLRREAGYEDMMKAIKESPWAQRSKKLPTCYHPRQEHGGWVEGDEISKAS